MAGQLHMPGWVRIWLTATIPVVLWDSGFVLLRPHSMEGGALYNIWRPYKLYGTVDLIYGEDRWKSGDRFAEAQSILNLVEVALQVLVVLLLRKGRRYEPAAVLLAYSAQLLTLWKTVLYFMYDIVGGWATSGHNDWLKFIFLYLIPDGLWVVVPLLVVVELGAQLLRHVNPTADKVAAKLE